MGYRVSELRKIRAGSIGAERDWVTESDLDAPCRNRRVHVPAWRTLLTHAAMVARYARDPTQ